MKIKRNILLNPGPATTTDTVKYAQIVPDICPREKEFGSVMEFVSKGLVNLVGNNDEYSAILFGGSGTAAVEAMISSVVNDEIILIINNGAYGRRMCQMASIYSLKYIEFKASPVEGIDLGLLEKVLKCFNSGEKRDISCLDELNKCITTDKELCESIKINNIDDESLKDCKISHVAVVHHETTTGILNDIGYIGNLCGRYNAELIVDAMSSFAGIPIDMKMMNIKYLASSSNKCIQGMAGVSFVIADKKALEETKDIKKRNLYLNLYDQYSYFKEKYQMRFTPPVQVLYALKQAIIEAEEETIEGRHARYTECCNILWEGLNKLGLKRLVSDENSSMLLTTIIEPENPEYNFLDLHDFLYERGFTIYPGKIESNNTFRIANIGDIYPENMRRFIELMEEYFEY